jgi:hypothetical protein
MKEMGDMREMKEMGEMGDNTARLRKTVGWVEALRNPTEPTKCWVSFLNPTYTG